MTASDWALNELRIAVKRETDKAKADGHPEDADYGIACYKSAYNAYKTLMRAGHSGMSFDITKNILNRLLDDLPLTPIEDVPKVWEKCTDSVGLYDVYICVRYPRLYKYVYDGKRTEFFDDGRTVCKDVHGLSKSYYYSKFCARLVDKMFPITFPYVPRSKKYIVTQGLYRSIECGKQVKLSDYTLMYISDIVTPDNKKVTVDKYFQEINGDAVEITKEEFNNWRAK